MSQLICSSYLKALSDRMWVAAPHQDVYGAERCMRYCASAKHERTAGFLAQHGHSSGPGSQELVHGGDGSLGAEL